jgi:hypothetical protein
MDPPSPVSTGPTPLPHTSAVRPAQPEPSAPIDPPGLPTAAPGFGLRGETIGAEAVELGYGLQLEDGFAYNVHFEAVAESADGRDFAVWAIGGSGSFGFGAKQDGGMITPLFPASPTLPLTTPGAATWTLAVTTAEAPTRIAFMFQAGRAGVRCVARVVVTEVMRAGNAQS